jgi:growth factor-regulated tyrosine kinase substrate
LKEAEEQAKKHAASLKKSSENNANSQSSQAFVMPRNDYELSLVEAEYINLFSTFVDRLQHQPPGTILREPQIQELYESIGKLRPKLARTLGEAMSKSDTLLDLHAKLSSVVRMYDSALEMRLSQTYNQRNTAYAPYGIPSLAAGLPHNTYPSIPSVVPPSTNQSTGMETYYFGNAPADSYVAQQQPQQQQPQQQPQQQQQYGPPPQTYQNHPQSVSPYVQNQTNFHQPQQGTPTPSNQPFSAESYHPAPPTQQTQAPQAPYNQPPSPQAYHQPPPPIQQQQLPPQPYQQMAPQQQQPAPSYHPQLQEQKSTVPYPTFTNHTEHQYPAAPTHDPAGISARPQPVAVEETLIDL